MKVGELEARIWELEGIRVLILAPSHEEVAGYRYCSPAGQTCRVAEWLETRVRPSVPNHMVMVLQGNGRQPQGNVPLHRLRHTYG
ncbi:MAG: hypothetical protein QNK18_10835 [Gammaproteobacteria bacterium]|nr:hypothetical protein [Gammaproteobacteria bacterium]